MVREMILFTNGKGNDALYYIWRSLCYHANTISFECRFLRVYAQLVDLKAMKPSDVRASLCVCVCFFCRLVLTSRDVCVCVCMCAYICMN